MNDMNEKPAEASVITTVPECGEKIEKMNELIAELEKLNCIQFPIIICEN